MVKYISYLKLVIHKFIQNSQTHIEHLFLTVLSPQAQIITPQALNV
jgi:hypothetical protein